MAQTAKVSISLPKRVLRELDHIAARRETTRSSLIAQVVERYLAKEREREMAQGYNAMATLNRALAEEDMEVVNEVWATSD